MDEERLHKERALLRSNNALAQIERLLPLLTRPARETTVQILLNIASDSRELERVKVMADAALLRRSRESTRS